MTDALAELTAELEARGTSPVTAADLLRLVRGIAQLFEQLERHRATLVETVLFVNALQDRLMLVDELPESAPFGALIRLRQGTVAQRATLYLGNGPEQPLSKLVPAAV